MFPITKLSARSQQLVTDISGNNKSRSLPVSIVLARLVAIGLPLPSAKVECINAFFNTQLSIEVQSKLSTLNELLLLDIDSIIDLVKKFYGFRYEQVYGQQHVLLRPETAALDFFRVSKYFDEATLNAIGGQSTMITDLTTRFIDLLAELTDQSS